MEYKACNVLSLSQSDLGWSIVPLGVLTCVLETMRHDSSASRRKGNTPKRRPPAPDPLTSPRSQRGSGVSSESD